jgi:hypothetical protein
MYGSGPRLSGRRPNYFFRDELAPSVQGRYGDHGGVEQKNCVGNCFFFQDNDLAAARAPIPAPTVT